MLESPLGDADAGAIEALLLNQMEDFVSEAPPYDPMGTGSPVHAPADVIYKTWMTIFPNVSHERGRLPLFDGLHQALKPRFMARSMMIGQFYNGCPWEEGAIYSPDFKSVILSSPTPTFAIRYMVAQDHIFNLHAEAADWIKEAHRRYFPTDS